jgi:hypothetical protein
MTPDRLKNQRLTAVFIMGWILFNPPLLSLFDLAVTWGGVPLLYLYLFLLWARVIGLTLLIVRRRPPHADEGREPPC